MGLLRELEQKNLDGVIRELTENPTCIDDTTEKGVPLALYAAELGDFPIVKYIVEYSRASMNTMALCGEIRESGDEPVSGGEGRNGYYCR